MAIWSYRCYGVDDPSPWATWFGALNKRDQARHDRVFEVLEQQPRQAWRRPFAAKLRGKGPEIWEVIVTTDVAWRVFGYFSGDAEFTVTGIGNHKDDVYSPKSIIETSRNRRIEIEQGKLEATSCARPEAS